MTQNVNWYGPQVMRRLNAGMKKNLETACALLTADIKRRFPDSGIKNATKKEREANRSKPGEIPHVQLGNLKRATGYRIMPMGIGGTLKGRVGITKAIVERHGGEGAEALRYARALELGYQPRNLAPRPYLRPALDRNKTRLKLALGKRIL